MRCLVCERHLIVRIVLRFSREAVVSGQHAETLAKICARFKHNSINYERPELTPKGMKGAIYFIILDEEVANLQKRTMQKIVNEIKKMINAENLEEGFIETLEVSSVTDLMKEHYFAQEGYSCQTKK